MVLWTLKPRDRLLLSSKLHNVAAGVAATQLFNTHRVLGLAVLACAHREQELG